MLTTKQSTELQNDIYEIRPGDLSDEGLLLSMAAMDRARRERKTITAKVLDIPLADRLFEGAKTRTTRKFLLCSMTRKQREAFYLADLITGSLYSMATGRCLSSVDLHIY